MTNNIPPKKQPLDATNKSNFGGPIDGKEAARIRLEQRTRELREGGIDTSSARDRFWAPPPPDGWDYQWKTRTIMGEEQSAYMVEVARNGWEAVPLSRHPDLMPAGWTGATIEVEGLVLMERPKIFTDEARAEEQRMAREAVKTKEAQLRDGRPGDLGPREVHRFSKSRVAISVPGDE